MTVIWVLIALVVILSGYRAYVSRNNKNFVETWIDSILIGLLANLIFIGVGYYYREAIYKEFQGARLTLTKTKCTATDNNRKYIYDCILELKNDREKDLVNHKFVLSSSAQFSNFNFNSCSPEEPVPDDEGSISALSTTLGLSDCKYKISLGSFKKMKIRLKINGDQNEPDPEILQ